MIIYEVIAGGIDHHDSHSLGYFETRRLAEEAAKGQGMMGHGNGRIVEIKVYSEKDDAQAKKDEETLKTLTSEQRAALKRTKK